MRLLTTIIAIFILFCMSTIAIRKNIIILERTIVKYYDRELFGNVSATVTRPNRASNYRYNFYIAIKHPLYNNVSVGVKNYQQQSNVYKESIVNIEQPLCQAIKNILFITVFYNNSNMGDKCPIKDYIYVKDLEPSMGELPLYIPPSNYRFDFFMYHKIGRKLLYLCEVYLRTEDKITKSKTGRKRLKNKPKP